MSLIFSFVLVLLTSLATYGVTMRSSTLDIKLLRTSISALLEWIGSFAVFMLANVITGAIIILVGGSVTRHFVSVYDLDNPILLILSAVQGFFFQMWWGTGRLDR